jgi:hypothetical protein
MHINRRTIALSAALLLSATPVMAAPVRSMVSVNPGGMTGGLRRITFDESFGSCSAETIIGKVDGATRIVADNMMRPGEKFEIISAHASGVSCSVRSGNVLGND